MRDELYADIWRYEAMTGIVHWSNEDDPGREDRDRAAYDKEYGLVTYPDEAEHLSYARMVRFLVEICGHAYEESLEAVVEHVQSQPRTACDVDPDVEGDATRLRTGAPNMIETLFNLKVCRLIECDDRRALEYRWRVTRSLMGKRVPARPLPPAE